MKRLHWTEVSMSVWWKWRFNMSGGSDEHGCLCGQELVSLLRLQCRLVCVWLLCGQLASLTLFLAFVMQSFWSTVYPQVWAIVLHWGLLLTALPSCRLLFPNQLGIRTFILERNVRIFKCPFPYPALVWDQIYFFKKHPAYKNCMIMHISLDIGQIYIFL